MRNTGFLWIIIAILIVLDIYVYQALKVVSQSAGSRLRLILTTAYWTISVATIVLLAGLPYLQSEQWPKALRTYSFAIIVGLFFSKLIASTFFLVDDVRRGMTWMVGKLFSNPSVPVSQGADGITRSAFLSWLGLAAGGTLFSSLVYGFSNKYNYHVKKVKLKYANLPQGFKGLKILHISDIHSGSFTDHEAVLKGVHTILKQQADIVLFTGDLVNDRAVEMDTYKSVFSQVKAPMGVYSTLGNHDYGDYYRWESPEAKVANLESLKAVHGEIGWRLLMNEHVVLERGGDKIALLGIENWSAKGNFPKYGKMDQAYPGTADYPFKILMSHDPSHWEGEVKQVYPDIDLMLSGHTHGMQFGVELPGFKWSPVQYMYKQWAGLYEDGKQKLYVNRGFGFIGYPGRVGILPEITVIELV
ncbi:metallophosphoesterase [Flavihumibacter petaseus]|uniref:Putative phosphoesterase n=1 Tax=Flavihumibacter petaseus NBRC 106054 TaxID=1220578 RepID=A0A0E9N0K5_9BACT|nr:metallophosphoesterase [Flavihumibacter petaseus]GAO43318.1 putative phosphoesterase [Flavihumibacter petaseus NBRC 106054]